MIVTGGSMVLKGLIASDVDGTLIPYGQPALPPELFGLIREAGRQGYCFAAASGRDYASLRKIFAPVRELIYFISTNGAQLYYHDELIMESHIPDQYASALAEDIEANGFEALVSSHGYSLIKEGRPDFKRRMEAFGNTIREVPNFRQFNERIVKIAAHCPDGAAGQRAFFAGRWGKDFHVAVAGPRWIDFNMTDKGSALAYLTDLLDLSREQVYAFGDQQNDLAMLNWAGQPYLMSHAAPELRAMGYQQADDVLAVMRRILAED